MIHIQYNTSYQISTHSTTPIQNKFKKEKNKTRHYHNELRTPIPLSKNGKFMKTNDTNRSNKQHSKHYNLLHKTQNDFIHRQNPLQIQIYRKIPENKDTNWSNNQAQSSNTTFSITLNTTNLINGQNPLQIHTTFKQNTCERWNPLKSSYNDFQFHSQSK